jgi:NAD(P)-dependent dehydrogenase (short-subunit alcohol dehydrogenase family)
MDPAGRHALVTGGGRGIGAAIAAALTAAGARVTVLGRDPAPLSELVESGGAAAFADADVTDAPALAAAMARAAAGLGPVEILVNNAGAADGAPFARTERALWDRMLAVNLTSVFETTRLALPGMLEGGWGRVVNIASTAGLTGYPCATAYVAAKHGVVGLTRALALELARSGVTVNAVCPGFMEAAMRASPPCASPPYVSPPYVSPPCANPQGRFVRPEEVAAAVLYLCGDHTGATTGQALAVAGGEAM